MLQSGLSEEIEEEEDITRFLFQSSHFNSLMAKPGGFLPDPKTSNASTSRCTNDEGEIKEAYRLSNGTRILKAAATFKAKVAFLEKLEIHASEPPLRHANIEKWPWLDDETATKAAQKEIAIKLATSSTLTIISSDS